MSEFKDLKPLGWYGAGGQQWYGTWAKCPDCELECLWTEDGKPTQLHRGEHE